MFILRPSSHILPFQNVVLRFSNPRFGATWRLWGPQPPKGPSVWWFGDCRLFWHCSCSPLLVAAALGQSLGHCRLPERGLLQARRELGHVEKKILCIAPPQQERGPGPPWGVQGLGKEVPRSAHTVQRPGTPPAVTGFLGWLSLGKAVGDPHPVPLLDPLILPGRRERHLAISQSPAWSLAPSGCSQRRGVT